MTADTGVSDAAENETPLWKRIMAGVPRVLLGLITGLFALIHFGHDTPLPDMPPAHMAFEQAMIDAGYFFPALGVFGAIAAILLIIGRAKALAVLMLMPIAINYVLFKIFLDVPSIIVPAIYMALVLGVAYRERANLLSLLRLL